MTPWLSALGIAATTLSAAEGHAQQVHAVQPVMLRIRPHVGDTLRMRMEQRIEMSDAADGESRPDSAPVMSMNASMCICTVAVVERATADMTILRSYTDSVFVTPASAANLPPFLQTKRALEGKTVRLHVAPDGGITIEGSPGDSKASLTQVPAMLPDTPVAPGDMWSRTLKIPISSTRSGAGSVRAMFRLDSLSGDGSMAYISMQATFNTHTGEPASRDETSGTIRGTMQIDRKLAWITDSRVTMTMVSTMQPQGNTPSARVRTKVTQSMRALPNK